MLYIIKQNKKGAHIHIYRHRHTHRHTAPWDECQRMIVEELEGFVLQDVAAVSCCDGCANTGGAGTSFAKGMWSYCFAIICSLEIG